MIRVQYSSHAHACLHFLCMLWGHAYSVTKKYLMDKELLVDLHRAGSQFWNTTRNLKNIFCLGAKHTVHDGKSTRF